MITQQLVKLCCTVLFSFAVLCSGCGNASSDKESKDNNDTGAKKESTTTADTNNAHTSDMVDNHKTIGSDTLRFTGCQDKLTLKEGQIVELKLEAIPGTGNQWLLSNSKLLTDVSADELKFITPDTGDQKVGQPGHQVVYYKAGKKGEESVVLEYKRKWEKEVSKTCKINVEVN